MMHPAGDGFGMVSGHDSWRVQPQVGDVVPATHRWWQVAVDSTVGASPPALAGLAPGVVWRGSVAVVPCSDPGNPTLGWCPCGLHAPESDHRQARSLASVVVGGYVGVLSPGADDAAVVSVVGPLHMLARCGDAQDGFLVGTCAAEPAWMVPSSGVSWVFCRRHVRRLPRSLRNQRQRYGHFVTQVVTGFASRYGLAVFRAGRRLAS